jgi:hypothetical protein
MYYKWSVSFADWLRKEKIENKIENKMNIEEKNEMKLGEKNEKKTSNLSLLILLIHDVGLNLGLNFLNFAFNRCYYKCADLQYDVFLYSCISVVGVSIIINIIIIIINIIINIIIIIM